MHYKPFTHYLIFLLILGTATLVAQPTPFFTEDFDDEVAALANWVSGGTNDGPEDWKWTSDPSAGGYLPFSAPTAGNGFLIFDSDANGENPHEITLTSPAINASGQNQVFLEIYTQYIYYFQGSQVELGISTDGTNFVYQDILTNVPPDYRFATGQRVVVEIPDAINQPTVYIQLRWNGFFEYFLAVDDIALYNAEPILTNDMEIYNVLYPLAYQTPISQVDSIFFINMAENIGTDPQTNVHARITVLNPDQNQVFQDSTEKTPMLAAGAMDTMILEQGFLPNEIGTHFVFQTVRADEPDDFTGNNREIFTFEITENTYAVDDGDLQAVFAPGGVPSGGTYEAGNFYYVKNGAGYMADQIIFAVASNDNMHIGETITILLYEVDEDGEPGFTNNDLNIAGFSNYTFQDEDTNFSPIVAPLLQDDGVTPGVPLKDSTEYLLLVSLPDDIGMAYTYRDLVYEVGSILRIEDDFFGLFTDSEGAELPLAWVARMTISEREVDTPVKEPELADSRITSFPNPATEFYLIDLDLESASPVQLQLLSMSGQMILQKEYTALQSGRIEVDVRDLAAGTYLVKVRTEEGVKTLKLTKH